MVVTDKCYIAEISNKILYKIFSNNSYSDLKSLRCSKFFRDFIDSLLTEPSFVGALIEKENPDRLKFYQIFKKRNVLLLNANKIKFLNLIFNKTFSNEVIGRISSLFANQEEINLELCEIEDLEFARLARSFKRINKINLNNCKHLYANGFVATVAFGTLKELNLSKTKIGDDAFLLISQIFKNISVLDIGNCHNLTGEGIVKALDNLKQLKKLGLKELTITATVLYMVGKLCSNIEELNVSKNKNYQRILQKTVAASFCNLKKLKCNHSNIVYEDLSAIGEYCKDLEELDIRDNDTLYSGGEEAFKHFTKLKKISFINFTDEALFSMGQTCKELEDIKIHKCNKLTPEGMAKAFPLLTKVKKFSIRDGEINNDVLLMMAQSWKELEELEIRGCSKVTKEGFRAFIHSHTLKKISLDIDVENYNDADLLSITKTNKKLKNLAVEGNFTGKGTASAIKELPELEELHLYRSKIDTQDLLDIAQSCPKLNHLDLELCENLLSSSEVANALLQLPELKIVNLNKSLINDDDLLSIVGSCHKLQKIHLDRAFRLSAKTVKLIKELNINVITL